MALKNVKRASEDELDRRVLTILKEFDIYEVRNTKVLHLSGGQKKKLAVAKSFGAQIIFLDEPTSGLDSLSCQELMNILKKKAREGALIVCTIHQPRSDVYDLFDGVVFLKSGEVVLEGERQQVFDHVQNAKPVLDLRNPPEMIMSMLDEVVPFQFNEPTFSQSKNQFKAPEVVQTGFFKQLRHLFLRHLRSYIRIRKELLVTVVYTLILPTLFALTVPLPNTNQTSIVNKTVISLFLINILQYSLVMNVVLTYPTHLPLILRELTEGDYQPLSYVCSRLLADIFMYVPLIFVGVTPYYFLLKFDASLLPWLMFSFAR